MKYQSDKQTKVQSNEQPKQAAATYHVEKNLQSLLSMYKWQSSLLLKHEHERKTSPFMDLVFSTLRKIWEVAKVPLEGEIVTYSNGANNKFTWQPLSTALKLYTKTALTQSRMIELLQNWRDVELYKSYLGEHFDESWFPKPPEIVEPVEEESELTFANEIRFGDKTSVIFIEQHKGKPFEVLFNTESIATVIEKYRRIFIQRSTNERFYIRGIRRKDETQEVISSSLLGVVGYVMYKNGNSLDLRKENLYAVNATSPKKAPIEKFKVIDVNGKKIRVPIAK
ncbi:hypothetical protein PO902_14170 [Planococcus maritimus]|nr:hypothetical protein [Planococcus sp. SK3692]MDE4086189.1 hypothetical protein [Planococcus maritimus]